MYLVFGDKETLVTLLVILSLKVVKAGGKGRDKGHGRREWFCANMSLHSLSR